MLKNSAFPALRPRSQEETSTRLLEELAPSFSDSASTKTKITAEVTVVVAEEEDAAAEVMTEVLALIVVAVEVLVVVVAARAETGLSSTKMPSQPSEADRPASAATKVNVKSLDCSRAFRCEYE